MSRLVLALIAFTLGAALLTPSPSANAETFVFQTDMYGSQESPPVRTQAYGFVRFFFNDDRSAADYTVDVKGLGTGLVLGANIHRAAPGKNGPVIKKLAGPNFIVTAGRMRFSDDDLAEMAEGMWYVSLKTVDHPDGEMRGQIVLPEGFLTRDLKRTLPPTPAAIDEPAEPEPKVEFVLVPPPPGIAPAENLQNSVDFPVIRVQSPVQAASVEPEPAESGPEPSEPQPSLPPPAPSTGTVIRPPNTGNAGLR